MPQLSEHEIEVFNIALELPAGERSAYLDRACAGDAALHQRIKKFLKANEESCACLDDLPAVSPGRVGAFVYHPFPTPNLATGSAATN